MMNIHNECQNILKTKGINTQSSIEFDVNGEMMRLTLDEIINIYMEASTESQLVFLRALQKSSNTQEEIQTFFEGMGKLLLLTQLSDKFQ
jgi:hypothetical protein